MSFIRSTTVRDGTVAPTVIDDTGAVPLSSTEATAFDSPGDTVTSVTVSATAAAGAVALRL